MKRALRILGKPSDELAAPPVRLALGARVIAVADAHDGQDAERFAALLVDEGARRLDATARREVELFIVIRSAPESPEARLRAEVLEEGANLVLGSPRPSVARLLAAVATT